MRKIELLAPAGSMESLYAAVQAGADAVYLGGSRFSARAYASNFDDENMSKAVEYCHLYNVKVYITINTILKENEVEEALEYAKFLYKIGVDALIVQDIGFASLVKKHLPNFELHASTQMTVHNAEGALFLKELGFTRIVLSRELSLKEIEHISKDLGIETEIFIHGALCVCYSGQCLMSSMIGGRSGNRGRCAQPCRLPYTIIDKKNNSEEKGYILSPKDMCTIEDIKAIVQSGTASLKIEGRMKRPEYVAGVVQSYRKAIDSLSESNTSDKEFMEANKINIEKLKTTVNFNSKQEKKKLAQLFNREGFSKAYLFGNVGKDMMAYTFPKNMGLELGKAENDLSIVLRENISLKDGVRSGENGFTVSKIIKGGKEVEEALSGDMVKLLPGNYKKGDILFKTSDFRLLKELEGYYKDPFERKNELSIEVKFKINEPITLTTIYKTENIEVQGEVVQKALKRPLDKERIIENLGKTGEVPFKFIKIDFTEYEEGFLPVSAINEIRRELIDRIQQYIKNETLNERQSSSNVNINIKEPLIEVKEEGSNKQLPENIIYLSNEEQLKAFLEYDFQHVSINPFSTVDFSYLDRLKDRKVFLKIPNIIRTEFEHICDAVDKNLNDIEGIITANLGVINRFKAKTKILGDYKLNAFNSYALDFYNNFITGSCLSVELNKGEIKAITKKTKLPMQVLIYGKIELMVSEYCAIGSVYGGKTSCQNCNRACERGDFLIKDRKGEEFIVKTDKFCRSYIYNTVPLNLIPNIDELENMKIKSYRADFIDESYEETRRILNALSEKKWKYGFDNFTRGHYKRGVE